MNARTPKRFLGGKPDRKLLRMAATFTETLLREPDFAEAVSADMRGFRADVLRAVRAQFRLRRGCRPDPLLDRACELMSQGKTAPEVLRSQIPGFDALDPYTRYLAGKGLRQAAVRRNRRSKRPQNQHAKAPQKNAHQKGADK